MIDFIVTGYPRSRTSWLALFLSTGKTICYHEPLKSIGLHWYDEIEKSGMRTGIADSAFPLSPWRHFLDVPLVIVKRDHGEAMRSFFTAFEQARGAPDNVFRVFQTIGEQLAEMEQCFKNVLLVDYAGLSSVDTQRQVWEFCGVTEPFTTERSMLFKGIRCTQIL